MRARSLFLMVFLLGIIVLFLGESVNAEETLYVEDADEIVCEGAWYYRYPCRLMHDGSWDGPGAEVSGGTGYYYAKYIKPVGSESAVLKVYDSKNVSVSVPDECFSLDEIDIRLAVTRSGIAVWRCFDGESLIDMRRTRVIAIYEEGMEFQLGCNECNPEEYPKCAEDETSVLRCEADEMGCYKKVTIMDCLSGSCEDSTCSCYSTYECNDNNKQTWDECNRDTDFCSHLLTVSCTKSDNSNYYTQGKMIVEYEDGSVMEEYDECIDLIDDRGVREWTCDENHERWYTDDYNSCDDCVDGACACSSDDQCLSEDVCRNGKCVADSPMCDIYHVDLLPLLHNLETSIYFAWVAEGDNLDTIDLIYTNPPLNNEDAEWIHLESTNNSGSYEADISQLTPGIYSFAVEASNNANLCTWDKAHAVSDWVMVTSTTGGGTMPGAETECDDYLDNDADGQIDCYDSDCNQWYEEHDANSCEDSSMCADNQKCNLAGCCIVANEYVDYTCGDELDNDHDGRVDCWDEDCEGAPNCGFAPGFSSTSSTSVYMIIGAIVLVAIGGYWYYSKPKAKKSKKRRK
jgi:hypothetical protein